MTLSLIVAMSENRVIGRCGQLPWHLPADLRRFKRLTMGHHIVMGRRTFESIGRLLPGRTSIIVTRQSNYRPAGAQVAADLDSAIRLAVDDEEAFIIGGARVYREALPLADRIYLTLVHADVEGDVSFPSLEEAHWQLTSDERHAADQGNAFDYSFRVYDRIS